MSKLRMLSGGIVEAGAGQSGAVSAFVAYNPVPGESRLFKVRGRTESPIVEELPSATTIDLRHFAKELETELAPASRRIADAGGMGAITSPKPEWVAAVVRQHLERTESVEID